MHAETATGTERLLQVHRLIDIELLVRQSEILTGRPGRIFVIRSAERLTYRVCWHMLFVQVERLDGQGELLDRRHLMLHSFAGHSLVHALEVGQLYTPAVRAPTE